MPESTIKAELAASGNGHEQIVDRVQSNVLRSMNPRAALYVFFRILDAEKFRVLMKNLTGSVPLNPDRDPNIERFLKRREAERRIWSEAGAYGDLADTGSRRSFTWTLAFTWTGLQALGVDQRTLDTFPEDFREGMAARAAKLGDVGASSPEFWERWFGNRQTHGVASIILQQKAFEEGSQPDPTTSASLDGSGPATTAARAWTASDAGTVEAAIDIFKDIKIIGYLQTAFKAYGFEPLHMEVGEKITHPGGVDGPYRIEHFGFRDGVSQPFAAAPLPGGSASPVLPILPPGLPVSMASSAAATPVSEAPPQSSATEGAVKAQVLPVPPPPGGGTPRPGGTWDPIALGELLLGRPDEDDIRQHYPANDLLRLDGTYMVFRKLEQDVVGFRRYLARNDTTAGRDSLLAARIVGRWPNGTSLVRAPDGPPDELPRNAINDFRYHEEDPRGQRCPIGSHARRVNPRDSNNRDEARRHRIWRRSITYGGLFLPYGAADDGRKRGLLFVALCARIDQQFEFMQTRWINGGEFVGHAGIARCPLTGANGGDVQDSFFAPGRPAPYTHLPRFVTTRGGDYFFMPSLRALEAIAAGDTFSPSTTLDDNNPGVEETPKVIDPDALFAFGRQALLPPDRPGWIERSGIVLVARHALVQKVLGDAKAFPSSDQEARIRRMTGGELLMLGAPIDNPEYHQRLTIWLHAYEAYNAYRGPSPGAIAAQAMQAVLARHRPAGRLDLVRDVSMAVPMVVARHYFGVKGPEAASPSYLASLFNKLDISQVPRDWLAVLPHVPPQDLPLATLAVWVQVAFAEVFVNVANAHELSSLASRTMGEFFRHLDRLVAEERERPATPPTLLKHVMQLNPHTYRLDAERFDVVVRLLLAEVLVAAGGTLAEALPSVVSYLLDHPDILDRARQAAADDAKLDAVIREALRFDPVGPILFRRCARVTELEAGQPPVPAGSVVAVLVKTAMFDPTVFLHPDSFLTKPPERKPENYLHFGHGPHHCKGVDIATPILREMVRAIIGLKDLRRAAGPLGNVFDGLGRYQSLVVRFTP